jgi:hypothetical protein
MAIGPDLCTPAPRMAEWIKILLGALAGMFAEIIGGLILEPLKEKLSRKRTSKRAKEVIYKDLAYLHNLCKNKTSIPTKGTFLKWSLEGYQYYYSEHREAVYEIQSYESISGLAEILKFAQSQVEKGKWELGLAVGVIDSYIDAAIENKWFDMKLFTDFSTARHSAAPRRPHAPAIN